MKKLFALILVLIITAVSASSCKIGNGGNNGGTSDGTDTGGENNGGASEHEGLLASLVVESGALGNPAELAEKLSRELSMSVTLPEGEALGNKIVIGNADPVSEVAYRHLGRMAETLDGEHSAWLIYSNGTGSVALAFGNRYGMQVAVNSLLSLYESGEELFSAKGILASGEILDMEYIAAERDAVREEALAAILPTLGEGAVDALRDMLSLYDEDLYIWMANLYDPDLGAFYFSNSGRDNHGFLPDIESTYQILQFLRSSGLSGGVTFKHFLPEDIVSKIGDFAMSLQSPDDGYFYHPQWGKEVINARRSRDMHWCTEIITALGRKPLYDAPDGTKGTLGAPGTASAMTENLGASTAVAVSRVISASKSSLPEFLRSLDAWEKYLDELGINTDSYTAGNDLAAMYSQIQNAGKEYEDFVIDYLNERQNPETGMWEDKHTVQDGKTVLSYNAVNGLFKIAHFYYYLDREFPNLDAAMQSAINVALRVDGDTHVCSVYNPWEIFTLLITSARDNVSVEKADSLRKMLVNNAEALIRTTYDKISFYKEDDGGFSYQGDTPQLTSQKALVACATEPESDVNATTISSTGILVGMADALGVGRLPIFTPADGEYFLELLAGMSTIVKNEVLPADTETFDGYTAASGEEQNGIVRYPAPTMQTELEDTTVVDGVHKYYQAKVVADPKAQYDGDKAYMVTTYADVASGDRSSKVMYTFFEMQNMMLLGHNYRFSADFMVKRAESNFLQLLFCRTMGAAFDTFGLDFIVYEGADGNKYIRIADYREGLDGDLDRNHKDGISLGEWFNVTVEMFKIYETDANQKKHLSVIAKIYVNGEYVGVSNSARLDGGAIVETSIGAVVFSHSRSSNTEMYIDNAVAERTNAVYEAETPLFPVPEDSIPASVPEISGTHGGGALYNDPEREGKRYGYDLNEKAPAPSQNISAKAYITDEKFVYFFRKGTNNHENVTYNYNSAPDYLNLVTVFEADMAFGNAARTSFLMLQLFGAGVRGQIYLDATEDSVTFANAIVSNSIATLDKDTWYNIRIEMYKLAVDKVSFKVFVNGEFAAELEGQGVSAHTAKRMEIQLQSVDEDSYVAFDNVYVGYADIGYAPGEQEGESGGDIYSCTGTKGEGVYYKNENALGTRTDWDGADAVAPTPNKNGDTAIITEGKYVRYEKSGATPSENSSIEYQFELNSVAKMYVVEFDLAFGSLKEETTFLRLLLGTGAHRASVYLTADASGNIIIKNNTFTAGKSFSIGKREWHNFRFEYCVNASGKLAIKLYIDNQWQGDLIGDGTTAETSVLVPRTTIYMQSGSPLGWIAIDNMFLGCTTDEFTPGDPSAEPDDGGDTDEGYEVSGEKGKGVYYNGSSADARFGFDLETDSIPSTSSPDVTERANGGYLLFKKGGTEGKSITFKNSPAVAPANRVGNVLEADLAFGNFAESVRISRILIQSAAFRVDLYLATDADGNIIICKSYEDTAPTDAITAGNNISLKQGEWHNYRFEASVNKTDATLVDVKVYIDGAWQCDITTAGGSVGEERNLFYLYGDVPGFLAIDNLYAGYLTEGEAGDEGGEEEEKDIYEITGGVKGGGVYYNSTTSLGTKQSFEGEGVDYPEPKAPDTAEITAAGYYLYKKSLEAESASNTSVTFSFTTDTAAKAHVIEMDVAFGALEAGKTAIKLLVGDGAKRTQLYIGGDAEGKAFTKNNTVASGAHASFKQNEWHNLRFEFGTNASSQYIIKVYLDGVWQGDLIGDGTKDEAEGTAPRFIVYLQNASHDSWIAIDNLYLGYIENAMVDGDPNVGQPDEGGEEEEETDTFYKISGEKGNGVYYNSTTSLGIKQSFEGEGVDYPEPKAPDTAEITAAGYYLYKKSLTETAVQTSVQFNFTLDSAAKTAVVEFDTAFGGLTAGTTFARFIVSTGVKRTNLYFGADASGNVVTKNNTVSAGAHASFKQNEWHNFRFEYAVVEGQMLVKVYVDGVWQCDLLGDGLSDDTAPRIVLYLQTGSPTSWSAIDNLYLGYTDKELVAGDPSAA